MAKAINVLLIDDSPDDLEFFSELLHQSQVKYKVFTATTAKDGIDVFKSNDIHCTFIDYNLPESDGGEILDSIRKSSDEQKATVILTGQHQQANQAVAARKGALDYVVKDAVTTPESLDVVIAKVMDWAKELNA